MPKMKAKKKVVKRAVKEEPVAPVAPEVIKEPEAPKVKVIDPDPCNEPAVNDQTNEGKNAGLN